MVSLANGNADVLSNTHVDSTEPSGNDSDKELNTTASEKNSKNPVWLRVRPSTDPGTEVTNDNQTKIIISISNPVPMKESQDISENTNKDLCNGLDQSSPLPTTNGASIDRLSELSDSISRTTNFNNLVMLRNLKGAIQHIVNNNMLKGDKNTEYSMNEVIREIERQTMSASDVKETKGAATLPSFVPLSQSNMKNISKNITLNVTPSVTNPISQPNKTFEQLRSHLSENNEENTEPVLVEKPAPASAPSVKIRTVVKSVPNMQRLNATRVVPESPAIVEARFQMAKCQRKLINAAIYPRVPARRPVLCHNGSFLTCEGCEELFTCEESLNNHKDRRSVLFTYSCPSCKKPLEFYNRCMFLMHARSPGHESAVFARFLTIAPIPANKLKFAVIDDEDEPPINQAPQSSQTSLKSEVTKKTTSKVGKPVNIVPKSLTTASVSDDEDTSDDLSSEESSSANVTEENSKPDTTDDAKTPPLLTVKQQTHVKNNLNTRVSPATGRPYRVRPRKKARSTLARKPATQVKDLTLNSENHAEASPEVINPETKCKSPTKMSPKVTMNNTCEIILTSSDEDNDSTADANERVPCRECKQEVPNLIKHYRGENRPKKEYPCSQCKCFNSSACALSAHLRMHSKRQPYVCPDCGYFFLTMQTFQVHVKQVCFYDFKTIRFKCPECSVLKPSAPKFAEHLRREHIREVFKCDACVTSSYSPKVVQAHIEKMHVQSGTPVRILEGYLCKLCPNLLVSKPMIDRHIEKHVCGLQYLRYVYICKLCNNYATVRRSKFANHFHYKCPAKPEQTVEPIIKQKKKIRHRWLKKKPVTILIKEMSEKDSTFEESWETNKANSEVESVSGEDPLLIQDWEMSKMKSEVESSTNMCMMCRKPNSNEHSSLFCQQCVRFMDAEDTNESSTAGEVTTDEAVGRFKRKFKCKICKEYMNREWSTITKHFEMNHQSDLNVRNRKAASESNPQKRKLSTKALETAKVQKIVYKYKCAKCNVATNERSQFQEHIVTHKNQCDFQCLECGQGFVVRQSLEKHLIVEHKIRQGDLKDYFKENGIEVEEEKVEERVLVENQCEVCYTECGTKQNYDKHIRTHGMAFVAMQSKAKS